MFPTDWFVARPFIPLLFGDVVGAATLPIPMGCSIGGGLVWLVCAVLDILGKEIAGRLRSGS